MDAVVEMIRESERIHDMLWALAEKAMEGAGDEWIVGLLCEQVER